MDDILNIGFKDRPPHLEELNAFMNKPAESGVDEKASAPKRRVFQKHKTPHKNRLKKIWVSVIMNTKGDLQVAAFDSKSLAQDVMDAYADELTPRQLKRTVCFLECVDVHTRDEVLGLTQRYLEQDEEE